MSPAASEIKKAVCVWCKAECGVLVEVRDGHLLKVTPDPDWARPVHPPARACVRLKAALEYFYHPARVNYPLKRAGARGEGRWQRISWEQALDEIASQTQKLGERYGWEAINWARGTGYRTDPYVLARFFRTLGTPNNCTQGQICYLPRAKMADAMAGWFPHYSVRPETKCIVICGAEPLVARPINAHDILAARKNGAKLIVIDPRRTRSAELADIWLQPRPGTDSALLLGMVNVVVTEGLYDREFVSRWCHGFEELTARIAGYPLSLVEQITGVSGAQIQAAARMYAANRPGCFVEGMGIEHTQRIAPSLQARWILAGLTANIDVAGGEEQGGPHPGILTDDDLEPKIPFPPGQIEKQIGAERFPLLSRKTLIEMNRSAVRVWGKKFAPHVAAHAPSVYRAMLTRKPYPVRAMFTVAANPMVTQANTRLVYDAIKSLDLHTVCDFFLTPTAELADYVLPAASWLESPILWDSSGHSNYMAAGEAALPATIPGEYEHRVDYDICRGLAVRLGKGEYWPWHSLEQYYDALLAPKGLSHHEYVYQLRCERKPAVFKKYETRGFATPTGKVELYSTLLEKLGCDPLPAYEEPAGTPVSEPERAREYPFTLINGGRVREGFHSEWKQVKSVRKLHPYPLVQLHPDAAKALGIVTGDWVWLETPLGRIKQRAELFDGIAPNVVHAEHGWWYPEQTGGEPSLHGVWESNINVLLNDDPDVCSPVTGGWPLKTALCKIYRADDEKGSPPTFPAGRT